MNPNQILKITSDQVRVASFLHAANSIGEKLASGATQQRLLALRLKHVDLKNYLDTLR